MPKVMRGSAISVSGVYRPTTDVNNTLEIEEYSVTERTTEIYPDLTKKIEILETEIGELTSDISRKEAKIQELESQLTTIRIEMQGILSYCDKNVALQQSSGYRDGYQKAQLEVNAEKLALEKKYGQKVEEEIDFIKKLSTEIHSDVDKLFVLLAFESCCKILGREYCKNEGIIAVINSALDNLRASNEVRIYLHEADYLRLSENLDLVREIAGSQVKLMMKNSLPVGGIQVEHDQGLWDIGLGIQMSEINKLISEAINNELSY
ncbi:FliH/SctL family protein [Microbulbifer sp. SSSA005]|uniref:FliH/SctL family protein n=1 Tax=Microbulbifer sp. SSSA005 TaxID=3243378 RepID=UPI00403A78BC